MKYVFQFARILAFCLAGELLHRLLPFPIPGSIYGLILLLAALKTGLVKREQVSETGHFLTGILPLLFVPGTVGIIEHADTVRSAWLPILIALVPVTLAVFFVSGTVTEKILRRKDRD